MNKYNKLLPCLQETDPAKRTCRICGKSLPPEAHGNTKYCSKNCSEKAKAMSRKAYYERRKTSMLVEERNQERLMKKAYMLKMRGSPLPGTKLCAYCNGIIPEQVNQRSKYCSDVCRKTARRIYQAKWEKEKRHSAQSSKGQPRE